MRKQITLTGKQLKIDDLWDIAYNEATVEISSTCLEQIKSSREYLENRAKKEVIYGVNTGFGPMADYIISRNQIEDLQDNLIRSHAVGLGKPLPIPTTKAIMATRLNTLVYGYSGVRPELLERLAFYINENIIPVIPEHGSVGASGDLVQLAHIALAIMGEGNVFYKGKKQRTEAVLKELNLAPIQLQAKEGLSLINGTSSMAGIAALLCVESKRLYESAIASGALAVETIDGFDDAFSEKLQEVRPHTGQIKVAKDLRGIIENGNLVTQRKQMQQKIELHDEKVLKIDRKVQDFYSFRCMPQILGPVYDTIENTIKVVETEINSVTDNPVVDWENDNIIHGGNFHGDYVSLEMDKLKIALTRMAMLIERRINFFMHDKINGTLPPFVNLNEPGLTLSLQAMQFTATSTTAECQTLCFPNYVHSISCNADNQDIVSMGTNSALITQKVLENVWQIMAIDYITLTQTVDSLKIENELSAESKAVYKQIREQFKAYTEDRDVTEELPQLAEFVREKLSFSTNY